MTDYTLSSLLTNLQDYINVECITETESEESATYTFKTYQDLDEQLDLNELYYKNELQRNIENTLVAFLKNRVKFSKDGKLFNITRQDESQKSLSLLKHGNVIRHELSFVETS